MSFHKNTALLLCLTASALAQKPATHIFHYDNILGTSMELKLHTASASETNRAEKAVLSEIERENKILSAWQSNSEFSRWMKTHNTPVKVSPELLEVLALFDEYRAQTGGALDPSAETATRVWKLAAVENRVPTQVELNEAVETMQQPHWALDKVHGTATHLDDAPVALNSFAKSYIAGHAAGKALTAGASGVLLNIGGDIVVRGDLTEHVAITDPKAAADNDEPIDMVRVANRTIATSGDYRRGFDIGGQHYSHLIDPRTGETAENVISSTVIAKDPAMAGALATAFSVMQPEESKKLAAKLSGVDYMLVLRDGSTVASAGWQSREVPRLVTTGFAPATKTAGLDVMINFEIARIDSPRYRRPYVAVWVEDQDHFPVRTLALWFAKPRWLNELKQWYRDDQMRNMAEGTDLTATLSSATRVPGTYTLRWDGKDNSGKQVKPGKYTILIEAAREHGGYDLLRQEINLDGTTPAKFSLKGKAEVGNATVDYGKH